MDRILVIGCPGTGKSTLSRHLAERLQRPLLHLDYHYHQLDRWSDDPVEKREQWRKFVTEEVSRPKWIIDGNYKGSFDIRMAAADMIIFLDYGRAITLRRMFARRFEFRRRQRPDMPSTWRERISWDFLKFVWYYRSRERNRVLQILTDHATGRTIVVLKTPKATEVWMRGLSQSLRQN